MFNFIMRLATSSAPESSPSHWHISITLYTRFRGSPTYSRQATLKLRTVPSNDRHCPVRGWRGRIIGFIIERSVRGMEPLQHIIAVYSDWGTGCRVPSFQLFHCRVMAKWFCCRWSSYKCGVQNTLNATSCDFKLQIPTPDPHPHIHHSILHQDQQGPPRAKTRCAVKVYQAAKL